MGDTMIAHKHRISTAFLVVLSMICGALDTFYTPNLMNDHPDKRWIGVAIGLFTFVPLLMLVCRIYQRLTVKWFLKHLDQ